MKPYCFGFFSFLLQTTLLVLQGWLQFEIEARSANLKYGVFVLSFPKYLVREKGMQTSVFFSPLPMMSHYSLQTHCFLRYWSYNASANYGLIQNHQLLIGVTQLY